jgi:7-cyano-7-deazaguanine synthase in queuosine biosynthesis
VSEYTLRASRRDSADALAHPKLASRLTIYTGAKQFGECFGGKPDSLEADLLILAAVVYAADRMVVREPREQAADRRIHLIVPVTNAARLIPHGALIERILGKLSSDLWRIEFTSYKGKVARRAGLNAASGRTLLFSGGLDSFAAALEYQSPALQLVSHQTANNRTSRAQTTLAGRLAVGRHCQFYVASRSVEGKEAPAESSQRTRSFLFLILGALAALRAGHSELLMLAENGQMAIHLPLTAARTGPFSTYTAHPSVLSLMEEFLSGALEARLRITNPYVEKTKAEVVRIVRARMVDAIPITESCWRNARLPVGSSHCGACVPCFIRRLAIEADGDPDPTAYARDVWASRLEQLKETDDGRRDLCDLASFIHRFCTETDAELEDGWPELSYQKTPDRSAVIAMYRRFAQEARLVLKRYPIGHVLP